MSQIYLIRHGQASFGTDNYDRLSDIGKQQAEILGTYLSGIGIQFQSAYSGSLQRQIDTAKIVLSRFPKSATPPEILFSNDFDEFNSSPFIKAQLPDMMNGDSSVSDAAEKMNFDKQAFKLVFGRVMLRLVDPEYQIPGIETFQSFVKRVGTGIQRIAGENREDSNIAVFTSSGTTAAVLQTTLELSDEITIRTGWNILNTSVSVFEYRDACLSLKAFNSIAHLEMCDNPGIITFI
jgi:broad specificity phosphatase PhoE